ncbi:MAG: S8 family serine peptidase [Candidatus Sericytochromatia bacterium]|nr:S8 family serine peptidase [Candidatus Sericytochromatia bacterium]
MRALIAASVTASVLAGCGASVVNQPGMQVAGLRHADFRADGVSTREVLVRLSNPMADTALPTKVLDRSLERLGVVCLAIPQGQSPEAFAASLAGKPGIAGASLNRRYTFDRPVSVETILPANFTPKFALNDPQAAAQYHLGLTLAEKAWDIQPGKKSVRLAVVDTGIDPKHPDLLPQLDPQVGLYNVFTKDSKVLDNHGHGTHTAGIAAAAANNREGGAGMAPGVSLMAVQVLDANGGGDSKSIAAGFIYAADQGAKVISASLGIYRSDKVIERALQYALDKDCSIVASAGNNGAENDPVKKPHLPSTYPGVIEVAATDINDKTAKFSNWGSTVTVAAPGVDIISTLPNGKYGKMSGTSMAAPGAAGVVALIRSQRPNLKQAEVKELLHKATDDKGGVGFDVRFGHGRINALKAVQL